MASPWTNTGVELKQGQRLVIAALSSHWDLRHPPDVRTPDSAIARTSYSGNTVTVSDQTGKARKSVSDALGRLTQVNEDPNGVNYVTTYAYDVLSNLTQITQGSQPSRTFVYDSLKRLMSTTNPESGTVNNTYDNGGNLLVTTDARGVSAHLAYDELNRVTRRWYNGSSSTSATTHNSPALPSGVGTSSEANFYYDAQTLPSGAPTFARGSSTGRLVAVTYGGSASAGDYYGYDALGRSVLKIQQTGGVNYQTTATYSISGALTSETYPSGRTVNYGYDGAGRTSSFSGNLGDGVTRTYSTGIVYSSLGGMTKEQFGTDTPVYNKLFYDVRGQLSEIRDSTSYTGPTDTTWNRGAIINHYSDSCWGMCGGSNSTTPMTDNNGNLKKQEVYIPANDQITSYTTWWQRYDYDSLNRLQRVAEITGNSQTDSQQEYVYDRYGNRTIHQTNTWGTNIPKPNFTIDANTNRLTPPTGYAMTYDSAGNLTNDTYGGQGQRTYDAENRMTQAWANSRWQTYAYDGRGQRVRRNVSGVETWQAYGFAGELLAEYAASAPAASPQKEYGYRNGQLLITADVTTGPPVPTFSDDFNDNSLDTAKWSVVDPNSPAVVSETGQRLQITLPPNTAAYNGISSNSTFDLTGKSVQVEVAQTVSQAGWCENFMQVVLDANNYYLIDVGGGSLVFRSMTGGVNNQTVIGYDPNAFPYWRIRHDQAANTINLETSNNGTSWTTRKTVTPGFSLTSLRFYLYAGAWGTGNGSPGAAKYDNFQLVGNTLSTVVNLQWLVTDQLGTPRMVFDKTGALANVKRHDYLPFGEESSTGQGVRSTTLGYGAADGVRQKFTSQERDSETGLDYMHARYFASMQGRFTSADTVAGSIGNPQSLNRYAYVGNNPMNLTDPTGHMPSIHLNPSWREDGNDEGFSSADAAQDSAAYDQRLENTRDAIAANAAQASGDLHTRDQIMAANSTLEFSSTNSSSSSSPNIAVEMAASTSWAPQAAGGQVQGPGAGAHPVSAVGGRNNTVVITYDDRTEEVRSRGSRSWRNNNPGNIRTGARLAGEIGAAGGFAVFETEAAGQAAIVELLRRPAYQRLTVSQAIARWAPPNENDTAAYQQWVQNQCCPR